LPHKLPPYANRQWDSKENLRECVQLALRAADGCEVSRECLWVDGVRAIVRAAKIGHPWACQALREHGQKTGLALDRVCKEEGVDLPKLLADYLRHSQMRLDY
jgi:hypothetical protein